MKSSAMKMRSSDPNTVDVAILGSGPAGCSAALTLKQLLPELRVQVIDRAGINRVEVGESLPPRTARDLRKLGIWQSFVDSEPLKQIGYQSSWGTPELNTFDFFSATDGAGWHISKIDFCQLFTDALDHAGIPHTSLNKAPVISLDEESARIIDATHNDLVCNCRFVIDATGRRFQMAKQQNIKLRHFDRLCMMCCEFELHGNNEGYSGPLVESCPLGWWFSTQTNHSHGDTTMPKLLVGLFTDTDIASDYSLKNPSLWKAQLEKSTHTIDRLSRQTLSITDIDNDNEQCHPRILAARSTIPETIAGDRWISTGDSAGTYDPLSGQGIYKAINNGLQAGEAVAELMQTNSRLKLQRYADSLVIGYQGYLERKREHYAIEQRWSSSPFWQRRLH